MKKWQKWLVCGASAIIVVSSAITCINSFKNEDSKTNTDTGTETACVQVVEG